MSEEERKRKLEKKLQEIVDYWCGGYA